MKVILLIGICLIVVVLLLIFAICVLQLLIVLFLFKEFRKITELKGEEELPKEAVHEKEVVIQCKKDCEIAIKELHETVSNILEKMNLEERKRKEPVDVDSGKDFLGNNIIKESVYDEKTREIQDIQLMNLQNDVKKIDANQKKRGHLLEINEAIDKRNYGMYIDKNQWKKIGIGDGRNELAEVNKIVYKPGNVVIKEVTQDLYFALPVKIEWTRGDLVRDVMKECFDIKQDTTTYGTYNIVKIKEFGVLQKMGDEFIVKKKGEIEVVLIK